MAAPVIDTEGMDINSWLKRKGLQNLIPKFTEAGLTLDDIMQCSEDDIRELCVENKWKVSVRIKLISAIKSTPGSAASQSQQKIVFLGDKEKEILEKLYKKTEKISQDANELQKAINSLEKSAIECNKDIHSKCDILASIIEKKRKFLLNKVNELKNKRRAELEMELNKLQEMSESAMKSQNECKKIAMTGDMSSSLRLQKMSATIESQNEIEKKMDFDTNKINKSEVKLVVIYDQNAFNSNFDAALNVKFSDEQQFELKYETEENKDIEILTFSSTYKSKNGLQLSDDNRCVKKLETNHKYILADVEAVRNGIHCWRIQTKNPTPWWIMWGVSEKKKFGDDSYNDKTVRGAAPAKSHWYGKSHNNPTIDQFNVKECEVDMLLNVDEGKLDLCVVGYNDDQHTIKFWDLPIGEYGWIPHFNIFEKGIAIRIAKIPASLFGKQKENIFK